MNSKVSVVISVWNRVKEIKIAIDSILVQDYEDVEIIVVDNHSTDGTVDYLKSLSSSVNLILMDHSNYSAMETLNNGFRKATGEYILVMDDDAYLTRPDDISNLVQLMNSNPNAAIIATNVIDIYGNVAIQFKDENFNTVTIDTFDHQLTRPFKYIDFSGAVALFRKDLVEQVGFYDEKLFIYWNEADLALKMIAIGHDVIYAPNIRPVHLASMTNRVHCRNHFYYIRNGNRIINENLGIRERLVLVPLRTIVYSLKYIRECKPGLKTVCKLMVDNLKSFIGIFYGERLVYTNEETHLWVRKIYTRFFWKDLYFQIFKV
jgi:hypothetical protein